MWHAVTWLTAEMSGPFAWGHLAAVLAAVAMTYLCCHPVLSFVRRGWKIKKEEVVDSLSPHAKSIYLAAFLKKPSKNAVVDFENMYDWRYGRYRLITPGALLAVILLPLTFLVTERAVAALVVANGWMVSQAPLAHFIALPRIAAAAIVGGYTWVVYSLISAAVSYNLPPGTILTSVLRLVVAVPMGYAVASLAAPALAPFIAFAIGAFPLSTIQLFLQRITSKQLSQDLPVDSKRDVVTQLNGIDQATADRLLDGDITTIPQLAYCDPVQVAMRTNLTFNFVLDLVGQALAWIYFGAKIELLRPLGLRGAVEVHSLLNDMKSSDSDTRQAAEATFSAAAKAVGIDPPAAFRTVCVEIAEDPYTKFVVEVWAYSGVAMNSDEIKKKAYLLWEQAGRPEGRAEEFWRRAKAA